MQSPSLKFFLPVFTNFSSFPVSFSAFVIFNYNYDEHLTWIKFRVHLIRGRPKFHIWHVSSFTVEGFKRMERCALRLVERFWLVKTFVSECLNFS